MTNSVEKLILTEKFFSVELISASSRNNVLDSF